MVCGRIEPLSRIKTTFENLPLCPSQDKLLYVGRQVRNQFLFPVSTVENKWPRWLLLQIWQFSSKGSAALHDLFFTSQTHLNWQGVWEDGARDIWGVVHFSTLHPSPTASWLFTFWSFAAFLALWKDGPLQNYTDLFTFLEFCQAQPKLQAELDAELASFSIPPAARPAVQNSSEWAGN